MKKAILITLCFVVCFANAQHKSSRKNEGTIRVAGASLFFKSIGSGEPVVVLHGGPGLDHTYLLPQLSPLAKHHTLIFYDQRASGKSTGSVDSATITINQFVEDLEEFRKAMKIEKLNLLGHSWGGLLAMDYAIKYPQCVKSLILANSVGATQESWIDASKNRERRRTPHDSASLKQIMSSSEFVKGDLTTMRRFAKMFFRSYFHNQSLGESLSVDFTEQTARNLFAIFGLMGKYWSSYNIAKDLKELHCPTLILYSDDDIIPSVYSQQLNEYIPGSKLALLKNCGHFSFIEAPKEFFGECEKFLDMIPLK